MAELERLLEMQQVAELEQLWWLLTVGWSQEFPLPLLYHRRLPAASWKVLLLQVNQVPPNRYGYPSIRSAAALP
ncbi:hypothetical protein B9T62_04320 [Paenibacillus donghaensis]|uniref:Uncharacterized protein n=1 Tax=Paenibacillus donghaensis TaxID=414771 RepID=A0A2Z2K3Q0_9BACL|nr:hypothetical protein B9T62_04320 [Paenibacillus donghaensis]